ncbi:MAG: two-component system, sensor histidine kinase and response regulator [Bacteroidota bacterium]|nr:two-component system, sensor histidine kinase and response regulator [Bacteroidota bacterium]
MPEIKETGMKKGKIEKEKPVKSAENKKEGLKEELNVHNHTSDFGLERNIIDYIDEWAFATDSELHLILLNRAFGRISLQMNINPDDCIGKRIDEVYNFFPEHFFEDYQIINETRRTLLKIESIFINGKEHIIEARIIPIFDDNDIRSIITIIQDITEYKKIIDALRESYDRYFTLSNKAPISIISFDEDGLITFVNDYHVDNYAGDKTKDYFLGKSIFELNAHIKGGILNDLDKLLQGETIELNEVFVSNLLSGKSEWFNFRGVPLLYKGKLSGGIIIREDITERKKAQEALQIANEYNRGLIESSLDPFFILNSDNQIIDVNIAAELFTGYMRSELIDSEFSSHFSEPDRAYAVVKKVFKDGEVRDFELGLKHKQGAVTPVIYNASVFWDKKSKVLRAFALARNINQLKKVENDMKQLIVALRLSHKMIEDRAKQIEKLNIELSDSESKLKELNKNKDKFFSIIAHDLKNPFSGFLNLSDMLVKDLDSLSIDELRELTGSLNISAQNLYKLLENLLQWSRLQRGVSEFNPDNFSLQYIADMNIQLVATNANQKAIVIENAVEDDLYAYCDINMVNTVVRNLLTNACKFTGDGGKIVVGANDYDERFMMMKVCDNGIGMNEETISKLFRIDQHVTTLGTANEGGTGLGLILCKELVEKNGGSIWIESEPGKGSCFYFTLPKKLSYLFHSLNP